MRMYNIRLLFIAKKIFHKLSLTQRLLFPLIHKVPVLEALSKSIFTRGSINMELVRLLIGPGVENRLLKDLQGELLWKVSQSDSENFGDVFEAARLCIEAEADVNMVQPAGHARTGIHNITFFTLNSTLLRHDA